MEGLGSENMIERKNMGKIFYVMGKSASGKDTVFKRILQQLPQLKTVVPYTTRPIRTGETDGLEYHFTTEEELEDLKQAGRTIELRTYQTVFGPWSYSTVDDGQINLEEHNYLMIGTLESYRETRNYFGEEGVVPIYIEVEDGQRLTRALEREREQTSPGYAELCRRFLADAGDFSEEKLMAAGIDIRYDNTDGGTGKENILEVIRKTIEGDRK